MATTPTKATARNSPERIIKGFQRTVIGRYSFGSRRRTARRRSRPAPEIFRVSARTSGVRYWKSGGEWQWESAGMGRRDGTSPNRRRSTVGICSGRSRFRGGKAICPDTSSRLQSIAVPYRDQASHRIEIPRRCIKRSFRGNPVSLSFGVDLRRAACRSQLRRKVGYRDKSRQNSPEVPRPRRGTTS